MRLAVFGATGLTGGRVVEQALAQDHEVVALVRDPGRVTARHPRLTVLRGSPTAPADVEACVRGADAVIHCLGIGGQGDGRPNTLVSDSVRVVLSAMAACGVRRIVCMSNIGAGGSGSWFARRVVIPLFLRWLRPILQDKDRMEAMLRGSGAEWVAVRLPRIVDGPVRPVRVSADGRGLGWSISAASCASFLLAQAAGSDFLRAAPGISH